MLRREVCLLPAIQCCESGRKTHPDLSPVSLFVDEMALPGPTAGLSDIKVEVGEHAAQSAIPAS